jgi:dihydropyrimidinase
MSAIALEQPRARARASRAHLVEPHGELLSTNPAKLFGLYPRKGTIAVGSDADIVVFDPERKHSKTDYNLYEVTGTPEVVLLRGQILVENDELVAEPGVGQFVARAKFGKSSSRPARP